MDRFSAAMESFLSHPILWGVFALVTLAVALSGKLSVNAATILLWVAYGAAIFGVFRAEASIRNDPLLKYLILLTVAGALSIGAVSLQRWFKSKSVEIASTPDKPDAIANSPGKGTPPTKITPQPSLEEKLEAIKKKRLAEGVPNSLAESDLASYRLKFRPDKLTLYDLYLTDFTLTTKAGARRTIVLKNHDDPNGRLIEVEHFVAMALEPPVKVMGFYIPWSNDTYDACEALSDKYGSMYASDDPNGNAYVKQPGDSDISTSAKINFSGHIYIYHETELSAVQIGDLTRLYDSKGLAVQFRGSTYLAIRKSQAKEAIKLHPAP